MTLDLFEEQILCLARKVPRELREHPIRYLMTGYSGPKAHD